MPASNLSLLGRQMPYTRHFPRPRAFYYHFNKPESQRQGRPIMTVHVDGQCYPCQDLVVNVPCHTRVRSDQPVMVMAGHCTAITITENSPMAFITIHSSLPENQNT